MRQGYEFVRLPKPAPDRRDEFFVDIPTDRPGVYEGFIATPVRGVFDTSTSTAFTNSDLGVKGKKVVVLVNIYEKDKDPSDASQHDLAVGAGPFSGTYWCQDDSDPSRPVYLIEGLKPNDCE